MNFYIHHLGKAGETFMSLPMARLLKQHHPEAKVTWVVLDLYRDALGDSPDLDAVETIPTGACRDMLEVGRHLYEHRKLVFHYERAVRDPYGLHIDGYYDYMLAHTENNRLRLHRDPFYLQFFKNAAHFCPGADVVASWTPPVWRAPAAAVREIEEFERRYGGGPVVVFSPYTSDKTCPHDNQSNFSFESVYEELRRFNLPIIVRGTKWDPKELPPGVYDGYPPVFKLGGMLYLLQTRAALLVCPNSCIGFAAHWLGAPVLMIDNRTGWQPQVETWKIKAPHLQDEPLPHEQQWPPFVKSSFPPGHLGASPFEQIIWSPEDFLAAMARLRAAPATQARAASRFG